MESQRACKGIASTCSTSSWARVFFIAGPTGVGKSEFALELASQLNGEIVGADAFQIYANLGILTAQPSPKWREKIPHWMIGCIPPQESYNAARYKVEATQRIEEILQRGKTPVVVGGTGLYFRALLQGFSAVSASDPTLRHELNQLSLSALQERLGLLDPTAASLVDMQNPRRVLRAIEICQLSGRPLKESYSQKKPLAAVRGWFLMRERGELYERILENAKQMWNQGVVEEVKSIRHQIGSTAFQAIGFSEILAFLDGQLTEALCQEAICTSTRQYAKRQLTWFRHQTTFKPLNISMFQSASSAVAALLDEAAKLEGTSLLEGASPLLPERGKLLK